MGSPAQQREHALNILMITNVFTPQIGGVTRSVQQFCEEYRRQGHRTLIIAPEYEQTPDGETDVIRIPAIPNFYQKQYSLPLPAFSMLLPDVRDFSPDIVHVHHPFLLGSTGQLLAADRGVPLVYTHHTRYSVYIETKTDWPRSVEEGIVELIVGFCELCDGVVAPSEGIRDLLQQRGITNRIQVIPTGVDVRRFKRADRSELRRQLSLPESRKIVGHVGRLAPEKNTPFLAKAVAAFLKKSPQAEFVVVGDGPDRVSMLKVLKGEGVADRSHFLGFLEGEDLVNAYAGFDVFAFSSHSETQGMVLAEAMAAGVPVVAVDATGVRDMIIDGENGRIIPTDDVGGFVAALQEVLESPTDRFREGAIRSAEEASQENCARNMLDFYAELIRHPRQRSLSDWERLQQRWEASWQLWQVRARAVAAAARESLTSVSGESDKASD
ncbi:glycosyltransferase [Planctomicrobium sp. SH661]|uniref:glycosyltransferase n=1 Tax=Planctomicrobium sp. SH661 TaxID=3448124 RepID=UPI003F5C8233